MVLLCCYTKRRAIILSQKWIPVTSMILLSLMMFFIFIYASSVSGLAQAEVEAKDIIEVDYPIEQVHQFNMVTMKESYFSMFFTDNEGVERYAIIKQDGGDTDYYTNEDIISREDAIGITKYDNEIDKVMQARLGKMDNRPVWEVTFKNQSGIMSYYYLDATDGEWIQTIANL